MPRTPAPAKRSAAHATPQSAAAAAPTTKSPAKMPVAVRTPAPSVRSSVRVSAEEADAATAAAGGVDGEESEGEHSVPEEVDNDHLIDEYARQQPEEEDDDEEEAEDDEDDDEEMAEGDEEGDTAAAENGHSKKRPHAAVGQNIGGGSSGPKSKKAKSGTLEPTNDEVAALRQTEELFKSNLFKLQLEELLKELHVDYDRLSKLDPMLHALKANLEGMATTDVRAHAQQRGCALAIRRTTLIVLCGCLSCACAAIL
jgi:hypothetical protein